VIARERHRVRLRRYVGLAIFVAVIVWLADRVTPAGTSDSLGSGVLTEPRVLVPAAILLIVIPALSVFGGRRFERYARSLVCGLTDRRLLVLEGLEVVDERTPETASRPVHRRKRQPHGDCGAAPLGGCGVDRAPVACDQLGRNAQSQAQSWRACPGFARPARS
jgi:hypothetical protein